MEPSLMKSAMLNFEQPRANQIMNDVKSLNLARSSKQMFYTVRQHKMMISPAKTFQEAHCHIGATRRNVI